MATKVFLGQLKSRQYESISTVHIWWKHARWQISLHKDKSNDQTHRQCWNVLSRHKRRSPHCSTAALPTPLRHTSVTRQAPRQRSLLDTLKHPSAPRIQVGPPQTSEPLFTVEHFNRAPNPRILEEAARSILGAAGAPQVLSSFSQRGQSGSARSLRVLGVEFGESGERNPVNHVAHAE
ncbi:hypothetical protein KM043_002238 [Ampulex compressa]|nr:hypothetical protein KM043_002238 [Ampulex compressa]